jgi:Tfp pilus assembly protein PilN
MSLILALKRLEQEKQDFKGHLQLYRELEASLGYMKSCLLKKLPNAVPSAIAKPAAQLESFQLQVFLCCSGIHSPL